MVGKLGTKRAQALAMGFVAVALLAFFFRGADWGAIGKSLAEADLGLLTLAVAFVMVSYLVRAVRWQVLLKPVGMAHLGACFATTVIGFMFNFIAPSGRVGEVVRPYLLARREGFSASAAFATIFLERVVDLVTVILLVGAWLLLGPPPEGAKSATAIQSLKVGGMTVFLGAILGLAIMFGFVKYRERAMAFAHFFIRWLPSRLESMAMRFISSFGEGLGVLADVGNLTRIGILSVVLWLNISLVLWLGLSAFEIRISFGATFLVLGFLVVGVAVPTPGAVGGYHLMFSLALTLLFGVDESRSQAAALVNHAIAFLPVTFLGLVLFVREGLSFREVKTLESAGGG